MGPSADLSHDLMQLCQSLNGAASDLESMPPFTLYAYFDESGKVDDKEVISFCGWLSPQKAWSRVIPKWEKLLAEHLIEYFHASEMRRRGENLLDFATVMAEQYAGQGFAVALDAKHFRGMSQKFRNSVNPNAHYMVFRAAINMLLDAVEREEEKGPAPNVVLSLICDQDQGTSSECLKWIAKLKKNDPRANRKIASICFANSRTHIPIQAADLLANTVRCHAQALIKDERSEFPQLLHVLTHRKNRYGQEQRICEDLILGADVLDALAAGKSPEILKALS
jgi:hypothetical protein